MRAPERLRYVAAFAVGGWRVRPWLLAVLAVACWLFLLAGPAGAQGVVIPAGATSVCSGSQSAPFAAIDASSCPAGAVVFGAYNCSFGAGSATFLLGLAPTIDTSVADGDLCQWYGFGSEGALVVNVTWVGYELGGAASSAALTWQESVQLSGGVVAAWAAAACLLFIARAARG